MISQPNKCERSTRSTKKDDLRTVGFGRDIATSMAELDLDMLGSLGAGRFGIVTSRFFLNPNACISKSKNDSPCPLGSARNVLDY